MGYLLWILSYGIRWIIVFVFRLLKGREDWDWQSIDFGLNLSLTIVTAVWFTRMVSKPKQRPKFVWVTWFITRLIWEAIHPVLVF